MTIIDSNPDQIRNASKFGFKIYYGDGSRLDVLRASGAHHARAIAVCVERKDVASKIVELIKSEFTQAKVLARSYDRIHTRELILAGVDYQIRETFESAFLLAENTLRELGIPEDEVLEISKDIRRRDAERTQLELVGARDQSRALMHGNIPKPAPLVEPKRQPELLSTATATSVDTASTT